jgi:hypothetical protein
LRFPPFVKVFLVNSFNASSFPKCLGASPVTFWQLVSCRSYGNHRVGVEGVRRQTETQKQRDIPQNKMHG